MAGPLPVAASTERPLISALRKRATALTPERADAFRDSLGNQQVHCCTAKSLEVVHFDGSQTLRARSPRGANRKGARACVEPSRWSNFEGYATRRVLASEVKPWARLTPGSDTDRDDRACARRSAVHTPKQSRRQLHAHSMRRSGLARGLGRIYK